MSSITVTELNVYPVKSCRGISLGKATLDARGFINDRRWMVTDPSGHFFTQRELPCLALISVQLEQDALKLAVKGRPPLSVPLSLNGAARTEVEVWDDRVTALHAGEEASSWLTEALGIPSQLVHMPDNATRRVDSGTSQEESLVSFADAFPLLLISEASLADLNSRMATPIPMNRFRPNIVVAGCEAFAEDGWKNIRIGTIPFRMAKACSRCVTTTVDQSSGVKGKEPLHTLAQYRKIGNKVYFGQNLIHEAKGQLRLGDPVSIIS